MWGTGIWLFLGDEAGLGAVLVLLGGLLIYAAVSRSLGDWVEKLATFFTPP